MLLNTAALVPTSPTLIVADAAATLRRYDTMVGADTRRAVRGLEPLSVIEWMDLAECLEDALPVAGQLAADVEAAFSDCMGRLASCEGRARAIHTVVAFIGADLVG